jgi:hypothetical protein
VWCKRENKKAAIGLNVLKKGSKKIVMREKNKKVIIDKRRAVCV